MGRSDAATRPDLPTEGLCSSRSWQALYIAGVPFAAAAMWQITEVRDGYFQLSVPGLSAGDCQKRLQFACLSDLTADGMTDDFEGVPAEICRELTVVSGSVGCLSTR